MLGVARLFLSVCSILFCLHSKSKGTVVLAAERGGGSMILSTLPDLEEQRLDNSTQRVNNVDMTENGLGICHIVDMNVYSIFLSPTLRIAFPDTMVWQALAAISLALHHLNTGDGSVVPELAGLNETCNVRFTAQFVDTSLQESQAVDAVVDITNSDHPPCAFIGAFRSPVSIPTAIFTGIKGYPQISVLSAAPQLNDKAQYPLFARVIPANDEFAGPLLDYLYNHLNIRHLAVAYTDNAVGLSYVSGIRNTQTLHYPDMVINTFAFPDLASEDDYAATVAALKQTGFRFFFSVLRGNHFEALLPEAYRQGIAGDGQHNWIISNEQAANSMYVGQNFTGDEPMVKYGKGMLAFSRLASRPGIGRYGEFEREWKKLGESSEDLDYLRTKIPQLPDTPTYQPVMDSTVFAADMNTFVPSYYDATVLQGLAACRASTPDNFFTGKEHYQHIVNTSFIGASGRIQLDPATGSRIATSSLFSFINFVPYQKEDGNVTFRQFEVAKYSDGTWETTQDIVFNDGSTTIPGDLPSVTVETNYIGSSIRAIGLVMAAIVILGSGLCSLWTYLNRKERVVLASQPIFLHLLCFGTAMMGSAIIPLSFDEEVTDNLDTSCRIFPWLLSLGWCISFSALFTKTMRVNRIFHNPGFRRVKVTASDVMKPLAVLTFLNVIILILWTTLFPLTWERDVMEEDIYGRPSETTGQCRSDNALAFLLPLLAVNVGALIFAVFQAFVARKISLEFAESDYIARAMSLILVVAFMAVPVSVIAEDNTSAYFFVVAGFDFVVCISLLGFIFVPKIRFKYKGGSTRDSMSASVNATVKRLNSSSLPKMSSDSRFDAAPSSFLQSFNGQTNRANQEPAKQHHKNVVDNNSVRIVSFASKDESTSDVDDDDEDDDTGSEGFEGIKVLQHPKQQRDLELKVRFLKAENDRLNRRMEKLQSKFAASNKVEDDNVQSEVTENKMEDMEDLHSNQTRVPTTNDQCMEQPQPEEV